MSYRVQLIISEDVESQQFGTNVINKVINPALSINAPLIPTALSFSVTAVVSEIEDTEKIKIVEIEVLNKNEKQIFSTGEVSVNLPPQVNDINFNRIRQKSPILYRWVMNAVRYEGYRW